MGRGPFRSHLFCHKRGGLDPHIYQVNVEIHPKTVPKRHPPGRCRRPGPFFLGRAAIPAPTPKERRPDTVSTDRLTKSLIFHPAIAGSISAPKWAAALRAALKRAAALRAALKWAAALRSAALRGEARSGSTGPWSMDHGPWTMVCGPCSMDHGPWTMVRRPWSMDHGP